MMMNTLLFVSVGVKVASAISVTAPGDNLDSSATGDVALPQCRCGLDMRLQAAGSEGLKNVDRRYNAFGYGGWKCGESGKMGQFGEPRYVCTDLICTSRYKYDLTPEKGRENAMSFEVTAKKEYGLNESLGIEFNSRGGLRAVRPGDWAAQNTNLGAYCGDKGFYITKIRCETIPEERDICSVNALSEVKDTYAGKQGVVFTVRKIQIGDKVQLTNFAEDRTWNGLVGTVLCHHFDQGEKVKFQFRDSPYRQFTTNSGKVITVKHNDKATIIQQDEQTSLKYNISVMVKSDNSRSQEVVTVFGVDAQNLARVQSHDEEKFMVHVVNAEQGDREIPADLQGQLYHNVQILSKRLKKIGNVVHEPVVHRAVLSMETEVSVQPGEYWDDENCEFLTVDEGEMCTIGGFDKDTMLYLVELETGTDDKCYFLADRDHLKTENEIYMNKALAPLEAQISPDNMFEAVFLSIAQRVTNLRDLVDREEIDQKTIDEKIKKIRFEVEKASKKFKDFHGLMEIRPPSDGNIECDEMPDMGVVIEHARAMEKTFPTPPQEQDPGAYPVQPGATRRKQSKPLPPAPVPAPQPKSNPPQAQPKQNTPNSYRASVFIVSELQALQMQLDKAMDEDEFDLCDELQPEIAELLREMYTNEISKKHTYKENDLVYYWDKTYGKEVPAKVISPWGHGKYEIELQNGDKVSTNCLRPHESRPNSSSSESSSTEAYAVPSFTNISSSSNTSSSSGLTSEILEEKYSKKEIKGYKYKIGEEVYLLGRSKKDEQKATITKDYEDGQYEIECDDGSAKDVSKKRLRPVVSPSEQQEMEALRLKVEKEKKEKEEAEKKRKLAEKEKAEKKKKEQEEAKRKAEQAKKAEEERLRKQKEEEDRKKRIAHQKEREERQRKADEEARLKTEQEKVKQIENDKKQKQAMLKAQKEEELRKQKEEVEKIQLKLAKIEKQKKEAEKKKQREAEEARRKEAEQEKKRISEEQKEKEKILAAEKKGDHLPEDDFEKFEIHYVPNKTQERHDDNGEHSIDHQKLALEIRDIDNSTFKSFLEISPELKARIEEDSPDLLDFMNDQELAKWMANLSLMDYYETAIEWCLENAPAGLHEVLDPETLVDFLDELELTKFQRQRVEEDEYVQLVAKSSGAKPEQSSSSFSEGSYICTTTHWISTGELKNWMTELNRSDYYGNAIDWCRTNGVASIAEITREAPDFLNFLGLTILVPEDENKVEKWLSSGELEEWLTSLKIIQGFYEPACAWCKENSITSIEQICSKHEEFGVVLSLKRLQLNRLQKAVAEFSV